MSCSKLALEAAGRSRRWAGGILAVAVAAVALLALGGGPVPRAAPEAAREADPPAAESTQLPTSGVAERSPEPLAIDPPAAPGSSSPALAVEDPTTGTHEHQLLMTWLEPGEGGGRLRFARRMAQGWSQPVTVAERVSTLDPVDRPSLTVIDTQGVRRTLIARTGDVVARSGDGGRTWTRLPAPPLPFASFAGGDEGGYAFWVAGDGDGPGRLLGSRILAGEALLDPRASGESGTAAAMTWDGPVVVYRTAGGAGAGAGEGIALVRRQDAQWTPPLLLRAERDRSACGSAGGLRVAALQRRVAVAWCTATPPRPRVLVAFSADAGRSFGAPLEFDAGEGAQTPSGLLDLALDDNAQALVLWTTSKGSLHLARLSPDGSRGEALVLAQGLATASGAIPQLARAGERVAVTWIDGDSERVRAATVATVAIPAPVAKGTGRSAAPTAGPAVPSEPYSGRGRVGEALPELELVTLDGEAVSVASLRGRVVLLNFWATWCLPCIAEMPELAAFQQRYGAAGLTVVGVSVDNAAAAGKVREFVAQRQLPFGVWLDAEMHLAKSLRVRSYPTTFLLDREGKILWRRDRAITADDSELGKALSGALSEP